MAALRPNETIDHARVPYPVGSTYSPSSASDLKAEMELISESHRCFQTLSCCSRARLRVAPKTSDTFCARGPSHPSWYQMWSPTIWNYPCVNGVDCFAPEIPLPRFGR